MTYVPYRARINRDGNPDDLERLPFGAYAARGRKTHIYISKVHRSNIFPSFTHRFLTEFAPSVGSQTQGTSLHPTPHHTRLQQTLPLPVHGRQGLLQSNQWSTLALNLLPLYVVRFLRLTPPATHPATLLAGDVRKVS